MRKIEANDDPISSTDPSGQRTGTYCEPVPSSASIRYCNYYYSETTVHHALDELTGGGGLLTVCASLIGAVGGLTGGVGAVVLAAYCGIMAGTAALLYAYIDWQNYGRGEYLHVTQFRAVAWFFGYYDSPFVPIGEELYSQ